MTKSILQKFTSSLWVILSFVMFLNGTGLIVIGLIKNNRSWIMEGIIYEIIVVITIVTINMTEDYFVVIYILSWLLSILRSIYICVKLLREENYNKPNQFNQNNQNYNNYQQNHNNTINNTQNYNDNHNTQPNYKIPQNDENYNITPNNNSKTDDKINNQKDVIPDENIKNNTNQSNPTQDTENTLNDDFIIDINKANANQINQLPGINLIQAKQIINMRENGNEIKSLEDLGQKLNLDKTQLDLIEKHIIINTTKQQRKVDI